MKLSISKFPTESEMPKSTQRRLIPAAFFLFISLSFLSQNILQAEVPPVPSDAKPAVNIYVEEFFASPDLRFQYETIEVDGFLFLETPNRAWDTKYSIVTDFKGGVLKSRFVPGMKKPEDIRAWVDQTLESATFENVEVRRLVIPATGKTGRKRSYYWIGNRSFSKADEARSQIALVKSVAESQGADFDAMIAEAKRYIREPEDEAGIEIKSPAQYEKEEKVVLKWMDQMNIGDRLFGPFHGEAPGEPLLWQSFGETTYRFTNLENHDFNDQVGFWTNRIVFKGIKAPLNTVNPYVEVTTAIESFGEEFRSNMKLFAGLEWRPLEYNAWLYNFRPWSLPLLEWVKNYRIYVQYGNRKNIKGEIENSADHDLIWGTQIFYEFGIDLPAITERPHKSIPEFLRKYVWGEYFGNYRFEMTNFGGEDDFDAFIWNSNITLGFRLPGVPLPPNPINDELVLMPYMRFEHVNNTEFSFPYQNQYFVAAGVRWMPFRTYRYKENEWLSKVKIFGEYVGVGLVQNAKQNGEAPNAVRSDWRIGLSVSSRRF